jgi:hypothetical protein
LRRRGIAVTIPEKDDQAANRRKKVRRAGDHRPSTPRSTTAQHRRTMLQQAQAAPRRSHPNDKRDYVYNGTINVASIRVWLRDLTKDLRDTT